MPSVDTSSASALDVRAIRADFPILERQVHGKPLVFLDSAASSQRPRQVIDAMDEYYRHSHANVHRGVYTLSEEATDLYEAARKKVARFIGAKSSREVIWTRNATESINLVAYSWGRANIRRGRRDHQRPRWSITPTLCRGRCSPKKKAQCCAIIPITDRGPSQAGRI